MMDKENRSRLATVRSVFHGAPVTLLPANRATPRDRARIINQAYADYYVPTRISETQMCRMDEIYDADLARSVTARAGDAWAGMAMLSHRGSARLDQQRRGGSGMAAARRGARHDGATARLGARPAAG